MEATGVPARPLSGSPAPQVPPAGSKSLVTVAKDAAKDAALNGPAWVFWLAQVREKAQLRVDAFCNSPRCGPQHARNQFVSDGLGNSPWHSGTATFVQILICLQSSNSSSCYQ